MFNLLMTPLLIFVLGGDNDDWLRMAPIVPRQMACFRAVDPPIIDGRLEDPAWRAVPFSADFVDIEGFNRPKPKLRTRIKLLWNDSHLFIAVELEEPNVWATLTKHDATIYHDNAFEWFIDPDGDGHWYYEFEINAHSAYWDLLMPRPYKDGGSRRDDWEIPGLGAAVHVRGTLNDPCDRDDGWSIEMAIPWQALATHANRPCPPRPGDHWRFTAARVQWEVDVANGKIQKRANVKPRHSTWTPQGLVDLHRPERYGAIVFVDQSSPPAVIDPDASLPARNLLFEVYYRERAYRKVHGRWAVRAEDLDPTLARVRSNAGPVSIVAGDGGFRAACELRVGGAVERWSIDEQAKITREAGPR